LASFITFVDGRSLYLSNVATDGMLWLISQQVSDNHSELRRWLADVSKRPAPFMDFDVRGFSSADCMEFYAAARRAMGALLQAEPDAVESSGSIAALAALLKMKDSLDRGEPPPDGTTASDFDEAAIDLSQIWEDSGSGSA
jgi:hypothetical protein